MDVRLAASSGFATVSVAYSAPAREVVRASGEAWSVAFVPWLFAAVGPTVGDPLAFYDVAATVIPVFVLAGLYQANIESLFDPAIRFVALLVFLVAALIGEVSALHALSTGQPTSSTKSGAALGLEVSGGLLVLAPLVEAFQRFTSAHKKLFDHAVLFWITVACVILGVSFLVYHAAERL